MAPAGDAAGAALGARGVACFLLFLEEASLLFVLRFLPMSAAQRVVQMQQECARDETEAGGTQALRLCSPSYTAAMIRCLRP